VSQLVELGLRDRVLAAYLRAATRAWPWAPAVVLPVLARGRGRVWALVDGDAVLAGGLLSAAPANLFLHPERRRLARDYSAGGFVNLSYFVVRADRRGQGLGAAFIRAVAREHSFWLACDPELAGFYRRNGLAPSALDPAFHHSRPGHSTALSLGQ